MESILIAFDEKNNLKRVLTFSFEEPRVYIATAKWLSKLQGQNYKELKMPGMLGSTITAHRIIEAVKRIGPVHKFSWRKIEQSNFILTFIFLTVIVTVTGGALISWRFVDAALISASIRQSVLKAHIISL